MVKDDEKIEIIDTEIKERIGFASLLYNRLYTMDQAMGLRTKTELRIISSFSSTKAMGYRRNKTLTQWQYRQREES